MAATSCRVTGNRGQMAIRYGDKMAFKTNHVLPISSWVFNWKRRHRFQQLLSSLEESVDFVASLSQFSAYQVDPLHSSFNKIWATSCRLVGLFSTVQVISKYCSVAQSTLKLFVPLWGFCRTALRMIRYYYCHHTARKHCNLIRQPSSIKPLDGVVQATELLF